MKLENRLAFITGGGRGIGRAIAIALAREGASVTVAARTREQIESVAKEITEEFGTETLAVECDVSDFESIEPALVRVKEKFGRGPDILVNNAGIAESAPFLKSRRLMWMGEQCCFSLECADLSALFLDQPRRGRRRRQVVSIGNDRQPRQS